MKKSFKEWLFEGMNVQDKSNKYLTCDRVNDDETKIIVRVADSHLIPTRYGWALILDYSHVVFLKDWAVAEERGADSWLELFDTKREALRYAHIAWDRMTDHDKKHTVVEVRQMVNEFDYDVVWSSENE